MQDTNSEKTSSPSAQSTVLRPCSDRNRGAGVPANSAGAHSMKSRSSPRTRETFGKCAPSAPAARKCRDHQSSRASSHSSSLSPAGGGASPQRPTVCRMESCRGKQPGRSSNARKVQARTSQSAMGASGTLTPSRTELEPSRRLRQIFSPSTHRDSRAQAVYSGRYRRSQEGESGSISIAKLFRLPISIVIRASSQEFGSLAKSHSFRARFLVRTPPRRSGLGSFNLVCPIGEVTHGASVQCSRRPNATPAPPRTRSGCGRPC